MQKLKYPVRQRPTCYQQIRPKPTEYQGVQFRSRLEARWALFFDLVGIRWKYEIETFQLGKINYLPDFYLPAINSWIEIKPKISKPPKEWKTKCRQVSRLHGKHVFLFAGLPELKQHSIFCYSDAVNSSVTSNCKWVLHESNGFLLLKKEDSYIKIANLAVSLDEVFQTVRHYHFKNGV